MSDDTRKALEELMKALEVGPPIYDPITGALFDTLRRLKLSGMPIYGGPLEIEGLDAVLKNVAFDDKDLKLWKGGKK